VQDFELIVEAPVEVGPKVQRPSRAPTPIEALMLVPAHTQLLPRGQVPAHASVLPRNSVAPTTSRTGELVARLLPVVSERSSRPSVQPPGPIRASLPPPRVARAGHIPHSVFRASLAPDLARPTHSSPPHEARPRARPSTPASALASFAPPPGRARASWDADRDPTSVGARVLQLGEDLTTARLIAVVPRAHASAVLGALGPLDQGLVESTHALLVLYGRTNAPHLLDVVQGLAALALHTGRRPAAAEIYRALYQVTGDAEYELRAADALLTGG
jgi:hypothetical protein